MCYGSKWKFRRRVPLTTKWWSPLGGTFIINISGVRQSIKIWHWISHLVHLPFQKFDIEFNICYICFQFSRPFSFNILFIHSISLNLSVKQISHLNVFFCKSWMANCTRERSFSLINLFYSFIRSLSNLGLHLPLGNCWMAYCTFERSFSFFILFYSFILSLFNLGLQLPLGNCWMACCTFILF